MARTADSKAEYAAKFKDPRWQRKRLEVLERDDWQCQDCNSREETLNVHHLYYKFGCDPWDYPDFALVTLCEDCHGLQETYRKDSQHDLPIALGMKGFLNSDMAAFVGLLNEADDLGHPLLFLLTLKWFIREQPFFSQQFVDYCDGITLSPDEQMFVDWIRYKKLPKAKAEGFAEFWAAYPRKQSKQDAIKAWGRIKPSPELRATILAAIAAQKGWRPWIEGYVPYGATWLNGRKWEDEPPPEATPVLKIVTNYMKPAALDKTPAQIAAETLANRQRAKAEAEAAAASLAGKVKLLGGIGTMPEENP